MAAVAHVPVEKSLLRFAQRLAPLPVGISRKGVTAGQEIYVASGGLPTTANTSDAADYLHWIYPGVSRTIIAGIWVAFFQEYQR